MFRGINGINLDEKGRLAMPRRYRDRLQDESDGQIVITIDTEDTCLLVYPAGEWEHIERKLDALPSFNKAARRIQRLLIGHATEVELDKQGRFLVSPELRDYAGLSKQVKLVGQGKKFEIWNEALWQQRRELWLSDDAVIDGELPEELENISL